LSYLPDQPEKHVSQPYLYTIMNTLDAGFFVHILDEIDSKKKLKLAEQPNKVIQIDPAMMDLLRSFQSFRSGKPGARSLCGITKTAVRKRKRVEAEQDWRLDTQLNFARAR